MFSTKLLQLDYSRGWPVMERVTMMGLSQDRCIMWLVKTHGAPGVSLHLVDKRHRNIHMTCATAVRQLYTVFVGTAGGNILAFCHPDPPDVDAGGQSREMENRYLLYGHLGGVVYMSTNTLGDMLVSVGQDKVVKVWRLVQVAAGARSQVLQPVRWLSLNYNISAVTLSSDSSRLLVSLSNRIQEIELVSDSHREARDGRDRGHMYRQLYLPQTQVLDLVMQIR